MQAGRRSVIGMAASVAMALLGGHPRVASAQETTLDSAVWSFPTLRSLRTAVTTDSLLRPAFASCREAGLAQQAHVIMLLRRRADSTTATTRDSLTAMADRHASYPPTQWEANCLLGVADSLPGLFSRPRTMARIEELVGLIRSGRLTPERAAEFQRLLHTTSGLGGALGDPRVRRDLSQDLILEFIGKQIADNPELRRTMVLPNLRRPPELLGEWKLPESYPGTLLGKTIVASFTVTATGAVENLTIKPPMTEVAFRNTVVVTLTGYRFRPALDRFGQPVSSIYTMTYRFGRDAQKR
jgi:hypothetical protein